MSMRDLLGKIARIDESMKSDAKKPTGPKFPGYWKGKDPANQAKNKMVGGTAEESILKDLEKALIESPKRNIAEEYKRYSSDWCQVCGQSPCNCTTLRESEDADGFYVIVASEEAGVFIGALTKDGGRWRETTVEGNPPYNWGGNFMSYLTPQDVMQHIRNDYRRGYEVAGPFFDDDEVRDYAANHFDFGADDVMEVTEDRDAIVKQCAKLAAHYMQSENLRSMFGVDEYIYKKMGIQQNVNEAVQFNSKQEVVNYFISKGKSAAAGAAAWERGWRGPKAKTPNTTAPKSPQQKYWWQDKEDLNEFSIGGDDDGNHDPEEALFRFAKLWYSAPDVKTQRKVEQALAQVGWEIGELESEEGGAFVMRIGDESGDSYIGWSEENLVSEGLNEYGGTGGYGAASQAPAGTTAQTPDPAADQAKKDAQQIQKSTGQIAGQLNQQGAAQSLNKVKFSDTMTKLDAQPNTELNAQELKQLEPLAVATSKALQNPQTATQMKQLIGKADTVDKQKEQQVKQAQQQVGTNAPADAQQPQSTNAPTSAGQTK